MQADQWEKRKSLQPHRQCFSCQRNLLTSVYCIWGRLWWLSQSLLCGSLFSKMVYFPHLPEPGSVVTPEALRCSASPINFYTLLLLKEQRHISRLCWSWTSIQNQAWHCQKHQQWLAGLAFWGPEAKLYWGAHPPQGKNIWVAPPLDDGEKKNNILEFNSAMERRENVAHL